MGITLTKTDKLNIVEAHIRGLASSEYNIDLDIMQENAKSTPDATALSKLNESKTAVANQIAILMEERATVLALPEEL